MSQLSWIELACCLQPVFARRGLHRPALAVQHLLTSGVPLIAEGCGVVVGQAWPILGPDYLVRAGNVVFEPLRDLMVVVVVSIVPLGLLFLQAVHVFRHHCLLVLQHPLTLEVGTLLVDEDTPCRVRFFDRMDKLWVLYFLVSAAVLVQPVLAL